MAPKFVPERSADVYNLLGVITLDMSTYSPSVNPTMAHVLAMVGNESQNDLKTHLPLAKFANNNSARGFHQRDP